MICCYRYPEGISLNGREYLLDDGEVAFFETVQELFDFINKGLGYVAVETVDQLQDEGIYIESADDAEDWFENGTIH